MTILLGNMWATVGIVNTIKRRKSHNVFIFSVCKSEIQQMNAHAVSMLAQHNLCIYSIMWVY